MSFLRRVSAFRSKGDPHAEAVARFWQWWDAQGAVETALAIADHEPGRIAEALNAQVSAIDPSLNWELGPGAESRNVLVVSCAGRDELRPVVRRWRLAGPAADELWQYSDVRLPASDPQGVVLEFDGVRVDVASASAMARVTGAALDVSVFHPEFAGMSEQSRTIATFLLLDTVLGESAVQTWVGAVASLTSAPLDPVPLPGLRSVIDDLNSNCTDENGEPTWALLSGKAPDGSPVLAAAQIPLRACTFAHLDTYVGLQIPFTDRTAEGLPGAASLKPLRDLEDHLQSRLGGSGRVVAHETHAGLRILHLYVDGTTPAAEQVRAAIRGWSQGKIKSVVEPDPGWRRVHHLVG